MKHPLTTLSCGKGMFFLQINVSFLVANRGSNSGKAIHNLQQTHFYVDIVKGSKLHLSHHKAVADSFLFVT